jgi:putative lipoic acid-binding regulatory protein
MSNEIEFPIDWNYKIIISGDIEIGLKTVTDLLSLHGFLETPAIGNVSKGGKYQTLKTTVVFENKEQMDKLSTELGALDCVKFLL